MSTFFDERDVVLTGWCRWRPPEIFGTVGSQLVHSSAKKVKKLSSSFRCNSSNVMTPLVGRPTSSTFRLCRLSVVCNVLYPGRARPPIEMPLGIKKDSCGQRKHCARRRSEFPRWRGELGRKNFRYSGRDAGLECLNLNTLYLDNVKRYDVWPNMKSDEESPGQRLMPSALTLVDRERSQASSPNPVGHPSTCWVVVR